MKKWMITLGVVVVLAGCIALYAKDTSGKRDALLVAACNAATAGELRYGSGCAEYCDGTNWIPKFGCSATTQTVACSSKPDNAVYNGSGLVTSTRNGTEWTPSLVASYSATSSGNTCTFHCDTDAIYDSLLNLCRVERADCETTPLGGAIGAALAASGYVIAGCNVGALTGWNPSTMTPTIVNTTTSATYGYHFQWGNNFGFDARPGASVVLSNMDEYVDTLNYGPLSGGYYSRDIFVRVTDGANRNDRSLDQNDGLWGNAGSELERQWPCATGWHLPTHTEWIGLFTTYARIKGNTTYNGTNATWQSGMNMIDTVNDLLIPLAGNRNRTSGGLFSQGAYALYWASTPNGTNAYYLYFYSTNLHPQPSNNRAIGFSVRCFQNSLTP